MKTNEEILNEFGKLVVKNCFDLSVGNLKSLRKLEDPPELLKDYVEFFKRLNETDFLILKRYIQYRSDSMIFNFLKIIEENEQFKLIYEGNGAQVNLVEISEMLKAEHMGEDGWIRRFSKELDNEIDY